MKDLIGKKVRGFRFNKDSIPYNHEMDKVVGSIGTIVRYSEEYKYYEVIFDNGESLWWYPASLIEQHLVDNTNQDNVNPPSHHTKGGIECIDAIEASMTREAFLGYLKGNVQKYVFKYESESKPAEDLKKAQWYLNKLISKLES